MLLKLYRILSTINEVATISHSLKPGFYYVLAQQKEIQITFLFFVTQILKRYRPLIRRIFFPVAYRDKPGEYSPMLTAAIPDVNQ